MSGRSSAGSPYKRGSEATARSAPSSGGRSAGSGLPVARSISPGAGGCDARRADGDGGLAVTPGAVAARASH